MNEKKPINKKILLNVLFVVVLLGLTFYYVFRNQNLDELRLYVHQAKKSYLTAALCLVLVFVCSESVIIHYLLNRLDYRVPLKNCIRYSFIGFFVSYITPSASGGQPAQMYFMKKDNIPLALSTLSLIVVTVGYKFVLLFIGIFAFVFNFSFIVDACQSVWFIMGLGVLLNIIVISCLIIIIFKQSLAKKIITTVVIKLGKMGIVKNYQRKVMNILRELSKYEDGAVFLKNNIGVFLVVFLITLFQRICLFAVTFMVYKAFGLSGTSAYKIIVLQTLIAIAVDNLPLPGGMGVTEGLYYVFFNSIFGVSYVVPSMVLSRGISFYALLAVGGVITVYSYFKTGSMVKHKKDKEEGSKL